MFMTSPGGSWIRAVFDEIALEGLEGTTLPWLWTLLAARLGYGSPLPEKLQQQIWTLLLRSKDKVKFYKLPEARPLLPPYDRRKDHDSDVSVPTVAEKCPFVRLPYAPVQDGEIMGNCADYKTRKRLNLKKLQRFTAAEATERWHQRLVVVASQEQRYMALKPANVLVPDELPIQHYIFWECIGRSRYNGETTAGPWSLTNYFKDSSFIFYLKAKFLESNLITAQNYIERFNGRSVGSNLVMLPRFYRFYKSHLQRVTEKLYRQIKQSPNQQLATADIPEHLDNLTAAQVKKLLLAHNFRKFFETVKVPGPPDGSGKKKKITVMQLRNPDTKLEDLCKAENSEIKEDKESTEFLSPAHAYVDMPFELECVRAIVRFGARGLSMAELASYVAIDIHTVRGCVNYLLRKKLIKDYTESVGKTRHTRYIGGPQAASMIEQKQEQLDKTIQQLQCKEEPNVPPNLEIVLAELPDITVNIRNLVFPIKLNLVGEETQRQAQRKSVIVQEIDKKCILHTWELTKLIQEAERSKGILENICRKSMYRVLHQMQRAGIVNAYEVTLQYEKRLRLFRLVTHPKIDTEHEVLRREVLRLKNNFHLINEERLTRPSQVYNLNERKVLCARKKEQLAKQQQLGVTPKVSAPKLLLARTLHEFFFYLVREQHCEQQPIEMNVELLQHWQRTEPALLTQQYLAEWQEEKESCKVFPYTREISWRTFIPPLPVYKDKPDGWLYFMDAVERLPLSLIMRIFRLERDVLDQVRTQLQHPVRQHYLLRHLQLQNLIPRMRLQALYVATLQLLNNMGLVQVSERQLGRDTLQRWIYLNRRCSMLDTTTSTGHNYNKISPGRKYEVLQFVFESREHIADYWAKLQHVCIYTKLGFLKHKDRSKDSKELRLPLLNFVRTVNFAEALELDDGSVPGDHQGAAGLCSMLYAHQFRHWSWVKRTVANSKPLATAKASIATKSLPARKRLSLMRLKPAPKFSQRKLRGAAALSDARKRKGEPRDEIDRDALRNMRTLRVTWTVAEDRLLKMGRAVYLFFDAPLPALALCHVGTICRDVIRQFLGICNKTTQACVRRLQFLIRMKRDLPDVPNWIYTMQTQAQFNHIYNEHFVTELKREYHTRSDQSNALLVHFVLVLSKLYRLINSANTVRCQFLLPDNLEDYKRQFRECMPLNEDAEQLLYTNPSTENELQVTVAQAVLHSILCCSKDKTLFNLQAFEIYKHFSEDVLNAAVNKARSDSLLVAVKRRNIQAVSRQISGPAHLLSSKYKYRLMNQRLSYILYDAYYAFEQRFQEQAGLGRTLQLASPNFAQMLLLSEWLSKNRLRLKLQLPANILTVDTSSARSTESASDRILDHYSSIFDNAPQTEYAKRLESEISGRQSARVRFHPANLTYRLNCSAYNQLSKLPVRAMHFFCALDSLGQSINISGASLELGECPFGCIMRSGNYLNAVERIVYEHRSVLRQLVANAFPQTQLQLQLDVSTASTTTLTVSTSNLFTVVQQLEAYWRKLEQPQECKDLGKALSERTLHKLTDWHTLCHGLLDFESGKQEATERTQDYEPSLNKEERARAQDVFVVHLPIIRMEQTAEQQSLAKQAELHKAVLDKVSKATYWRYTENSFATLMPKLKAKQLDASAIQHIQELLEHIEQRPMGVAPTELRRSFPFGKFLLEALHELEAHNLIKRVGVASYMYVHKKHMRNWVVHTFHIKRLERERVQSLVAASPATPHAVVGQKRKGIMEQPSTSKQAKLDQEQQQSTEEDAESEEAKRRSKRVCEKKTTVADKPAVSDQVTHDVIVMRPQPWIRVNASLNRRVLDRWLGAILSECITHNGCTVHSLFLRFPHLVPVDTMLLLELLCELGCLILMEVEPQTIHVECSYDDELKEQQVTELYEPQNTYIKAQCDAIGRLTRFIGLKKYNSEFI